MPPHPVPTMEVVFKNKPKMGVVKLNVSDFDPKLHMRPGDEVPEEAPDSIEVEVEVDVDESPPDPAEDEVPEEPKKTTARKKSTRRGKK